MAWSNCNIVKLSAKYSNKTVQIEALVSEDIKEDKEGRIWCANFSGQIFYVAKNQKLTLFKDFSKSY